MKRLLSLVLVLTIVFVTACPVIAAESDPPISPRYTYISLLSASLSINDTTGISTSTASSRISGASSLKVVCKLQRYNGSSWTTVQTWTATGTSSASIAKSWAVYSGYTYRAYVTCSVYNSAGVLVESGNCYSNQVTY